MSDTVTDTRTTLRTGQDDDDLSHWLCCHDATVTLCGKRDMQEPDDEADPDCVVCNDLDWSDTCPLYGPDGCRGAQQ